VRRQRYQSRHETSAEQANDAEPLGGHDARYYAPSRRPCTLFRACRSCRRSR
jgi:hypothetical protein